MKFCKKKSKNITKNHLICVTHEEKTVKEVKVHTFLVCACISQDFAQSQKIFARSHDSETVTFRNSGKRITQLLSYFMNDKGVCRAVPGLVWVC